MRIFAERDIRRAVTISDLISSVEQSFAALARGAAQLSAVMHFEFPASHGEAHIKGAHLAGSPYVVIKLAAGFYDNLGLGLPVGPGLMLACSATTGQPTALLLDNGYLTDMRTGAAGAVAAKYLARPQLTKIAVIGTGVQARCQLLALRCVRRLPAIGVWSRKPQRARTFASDLSVELQADVRPERTIEDAVHGADLVVTVTPSRIPLLRAEWLSPGVLITAAGSDAPYKQELDVSVFTTADVVIADHIGQCESSGEIHHAITADILRRDQITGELGDLVVGRIAGRTSSEQITLCDLTGVGVQDAAAAAWALDALQETQAGTEIPP